METVACYMSLRGRQAEAISRKYKVMGNYWVYIMTNKVNTVLYTGMTNNLHRRVLKHQSGQGSKFAAKYKIRKLVFHERFDKAVDAIAAEKRIKAGSRRKKEDLINSTNPEWNDLYEEMNEIASSLRSSQ
jgi:putative endonuclease